MYKVFFKDRVIIITDCIDTALSPDFGAILKYSNNGELMNFIASFEKNDKIRSAYIYGHNRHEIFRNFRSCFKNLLAAGGLVWDSTKENILVMKRLGVFDLPKGKVEPFETFEEAALREVQEECGITALSVIGEITTTFHTYRLTDAFILKETRWFEMINFKEEALTAQKEENIESVFWAKPSQLPEIVQNTYHSIVDVLKLVFKIQHVG
ncbi:MAG: NUDIX domain-containing protein [Cytophagaceae bacterium]|nr:NUDIX domain-containing protein [Cytophagaceae bacterium]